MYLQLLQPWFFVTTAQWSKGWTKLNFRNFCFCSRKSEIEILLYKSTLLNKSYFMKFFDLLVKYLTSFSTAVFEPNYKISSFYYSIRNFLFNDGGLARGWPHI